MHPPGVDCSPSPEPLWVTLVMGKNHTQQPKIYSFPPSETTNSPPPSPPVNRFKSFAVKSFISSPSNSNFQVIILGNLHLSLQSFLLYHILNFRLYVQTCHANLANQYLRNVAHGMTKALNDWSSPKQNFHSLHLSIPSLPPMLFRKSCSYYCLFSSFLHSLFISNFIKFQPTPLQLGTWGSVCLSNITDSKLVRINHINLKK